MGLPSSPVSTERTNDIFDNNKHEQIALTGLDPSYNGASKQLIFTLIKCLSHPMT